MMASTSTQTPERLASGKTQDNKSNTIEPDYNLVEDFRERSRKRKASDDGERAQKRHRVSCNSTNNNPTTCEAGSVSVEDVRVGKRKRKASPERDTPQKRRRCSCSEASSVFVEEVSAKGDKGKASADRENSRKKQRLCQETAAASSSSSKPDNKALVEDVQEEQRKTKASTGEERQETCEVKQSSCTASSSQEEKDSLPAEITSRADFEAKYKQLEKIGEGGCGSVAIKHIKGPDKGLELKINRLPVEVALMLTVAGGPESLGKSSAVSLLDWYYLDNKLILVMERPMPSMNLSKYLKSMGGRLEEDAAKILMTQLVDAAIELLSKGVFHRDIKCANLLVEVGSSVPRIRVIDFGCGCRVQRKPHLRFSGTTALAPPEWLLINKYKARSTTVWQLGTVLYRLLHGHVFDTRSYITDRIQLNSELSTDCLDFLKRCLAIHPKKRATLKELKRHPWLK
ncbi:serine/threonine-protein kinase pim-2-like [Scomber scombrus]|uniref:non-specific serine/threonine protein kinase n=1 Tax=Scomber scombrus TaxID=13677 RepID=A0AAV1PDC7_SCOSC